MERDPRLDFLRGMALMMIFINHMPGNLFSYVTLQNIGLSDAAEVFVLIAGIAAYLAYERLFARQGVLQATAVVFGRVRQLYVVHLVLFLLVTAIAAGAAIRFGDPMYLEALALDLLVQDPPAAVVRLVTLTYLPHYLDILPLYIVLLAATPGALLLFRIGAFAPLTVSVALFVLARWLGLNLPNLPESRAWFFNPMAWQLLFVIGLTLAHLQATGRWRPPAPRLVTMLATAYLLFAFVATAPWTDIPALANAGLLPSGFLPPISKTNLSLLRLANVLAQAWIAWVFLSRASPILRTAFGRALRLAGRNSLDVFALGIVLSTAGSVIMKATLYHVAVQILCVLGGIAAMIAYAAFAEWRKPVQRPAPAPAIGLAQPSVRT